MKEILNSVRVRFPALGQNESFARIATAGFLMHLGVTPSQLADIKTVVSEAVTNAIVHGYSGKEDKNTYVFLEMIYYSDRTLVCRVTDKGRGIEDVERAMEPFYTTDREGERSGMGLPIISAFCDCVKISTRPGFTRITMKKNLG
ncbi:MAG: anti-sigma F factor [Clostridia bacterium]|nr:anti-sigma F factor [Clostridia bacterium]